MRSNLFYYLVLLILVLVDGWLLAHPNLVGRVGIFIYEYEYIETVPRALLTVGITVLVALLIGWGLTKLSRPVGIGIAVAASAACIFALFQTYVKFTSGVYQFTGSGFKTGAILLPVILTIIFGKTSVDIISHKK
ncbi:hypothetical protein [Tellurirhabdus bombi]|uniref:hypothetical protein n=1 Tax=Tellurirhabdus bombi TaxID=2907205 RepID=UPI001F39B1E5|nr:hypothetical protein [Tellurirhabdus bombi]